ncbi:MAG: AMP-binding protein [Bacteroidales bacterium]|nr:AMP-binding protein [Bacteroidales bacterium]
MIAATDKIAIISGDKKITFRRMLQHASEFAAANKTDEGQKVLVFSENREGWLYSLYGIWANKSTIVPVDAACTIDDLIYIIKDCAPSSMWVSSKKKDMAKKAIEICGASIPVRVIDEYEDNDVDFLEPALIPEISENICIICYTSGTTGSPKGVMLTFANVRANIDAVSKHVPIFTADRRTLILLPLHHVLPLVGTAVMPFTCGGGVAICPSLAGPKIMEVMQKGEIGIMIGVPRLWQTLFRSIKGKIDANGVTRALYNICAALQCRPLSRLVFSSVRKKMGGKIAYMVSGGAALDKETAIGLKTLGLDVLEGYGMTEAAPMIAFTRPGDFRPGCVGKAIEGCEVKIIDGEICARGINIMKGYYGRPEETADVIDSDGFLHTGDLGTIDGKGRISITGRRKEIIVLSNGKNVNPNEIEEKLEHYVDHVKEAAVTFEDDKLVAIIVPSDDLSNESDDSKIKEILRKEVIQPFNESVAQYKKLARLYIHRDILPRTRMEKLQRFKLKELIKTKDWE